MSPEQKTKIDKADENLLWALLTESAGSAEEVAYIRDRLAKKSLAETQRKLDALCTQVKQVERGLRRSEAGSLTFWLALTAAVFASFSVPWEEVEQTLGRWGGQVHKFLHQSPGRQTAWRAPQATGARTPELVLPDLPVPTATTPTRAEAEGSSAQGPESALFPRPGQLVWSE